MPTIIQVRRDTVSGWNANSSVVLAAGEKGYETDTGNFKIGDGSTQWGSLAYQLPYNTGDRLSALNTTLSIDNTNDRVGIGNTSPATKLDVNGTLRAMAGVTFEDNLYVAGNTTNMGDLAVNGGDITTTTTGVASVFTNNATTLYLGGAATTVGIGAATGTTTINNAAAITGAATVGGTLAVTGATTLTGNTTVGGNIAVNGGNITTTSSTATVFTSGALTLNIGHAATAVSVGATSGTTTIRNAATITGSATVGGNLSVTGTTTFTGAPSYAADPASANQLARKSYVDTYADTAAVRWYQSGTVAQRDSPPVGAIILANGNYAMGTQNSQMKVCQSGGNIFYFSHGGAGTVIANVPGTWLAVGNNNGVGLWYRIA